MNVTTKLKPGFAYSPMLPLGEDTTQYRKLDIAGVSTLSLIHI